MPTLRYILGFVLLAVAAGLIYLGVTENRFAPVDFAVTAIALFSGLALIWTTYRAGRPRREERARRRQYRRNQASR